MAKIYHIVSGQTQTEIMSYEEEGAIVRLFFFDGAGAQVTPTGAAPQVFRENGLLWIPVNKFSPNEWAFNGPCKQVQISLTGVTGYATYRAEVWRANEPIDLTPDGLFSGLRAITVQFYPEANIKNGVQYDLRASWRLGDVIPTLQSRRLWFQTGAKPVLVKLREFQYLAEEMTLRLFRNPSGVAGGTNLSINNYNGISPVASTSQAKKNVTTTTDGVEFNAADPEVFFGTQANPQRVQAVALQGRERVLPANTQFIVMVTNTGTGDARAEYHLDWYEGGMDLPL